MSEAAKGETHTSAHQQAACRTCQEAAQGCEADEHKGVSSVGQQLTPRHPWDVHALQQQPSNHPVQGPGEAGAVQLQTPEQTQCVLGLLSPSPSRHSTKWRSATRMPARLSMARVHNADATPSMSQALCIYTLLLPWVGLGLSSHSLITHRVAHHLRLERVFEGQHDTAEQRVAPQPHQRDEQIRRVHINRRRPVALPTGNLHHIADASTHMRTVRVPPHSVCWFSQHVAHTYPQSKGNRALCTHLFMHASIRPLSQEWEEEHQQLVAHCNRIHRQQWAQRNQGCSDTSMFARCSVPTAACVEELMVVQLLQPRCLHRQCVLC